MKIEMGESLFYSWLRHVKECQIVQTNWKASPQWVLEHEDDLQHLMDRCSAYFEQKLGYKIFKKNSSLSQILQQGEIDAVGISIQGQSIHTYTVDVAFHESGLNYGTKDDTVAKVIAKSVRSAMLLYGYMNSKDADIIFASPKITPALLKEILPCIDDLNSILEEDCFKSRVRILANEDFNNLVLQPILLLSDGIADTSELFLRSYQMYTMFTDDPQKRVRRQAPGNAPLRSTDPIADDTTYRELKVGQIAKTVLRTMLEAGAASEDEVAFMQQVDYSKQFFGLNYPLLVRADAEYETARYYTTPLNIRGIKYMLCSQWFETVANNDRPYLLQWIQAHSGGLD